MTPVLKQNDLRVHQDIVKQLANGEIEKLDYNSEHCSNHGSALSDYGDTSSIVSSSGGERRLLSRSDVICSLGNRALNSVPIV